MKMKVLLAGLGSIGQRHYKNLLEAGISDISVYRTGKGIKPFIENFEKKYKPLIFNNLEKSFDQKPDALFITNPTHLHAELIKKALDENIRNIFVEKPISHLSRAIKPLLRKAKRKHVLGYVGYTLRFHPLLRKMTKLVRTGLVGELISASLEVGEYLPDWHPWEDYRKTYAARKEMGGGVVLTLSHEIDLIYWFFGMPKRISAFGGARTGLELNVEDIAKAILEFKNGLIVSLHMDYFQRPPKRIFEIVGTKGRLYWDYYAQELKFTPHQKTEKSIIIKAPKNFERNQMFKNQLNHFISCAKRKIKPEVSFEDGFNVLRICEAILESMTLGKIVEL